jgi:hypothetical protein
MALSSDKNNLKPVTTTLIRSQIQVVGKKKVEPVFFCILGLIKTVYGI